MGIVEYDLTEKEEIEENDDRTESKRISRKGGDVWSIDGKYTSNNSLPRVLKVKHYINGWDIHISIGPTTGQARASIALNLDSAELLLAVLEKAIGEAKSCRP